MQFKTFVAGSVTAQELNPTAAAIQFIREEFNQRRVCRRIHRRRGHLDPQFVSQRTANFIFSGPREKFDGQQKSSFRLA